MQKILSLIMMIAIFLSSLSAQLSMHFCGDSLEKISFSHENDGCEMEKNFSPCDKHPEIKAKACCTDQLVDIASVEHVSHTKVKISSPRPEEIFFVASFLIFSDMFGQEKLSSHKITFYSPPPLIRDIPVLIKSFLI